MLRYVGHQTDGRGVRGLNSPEAGVLRSCFSSPRPDWPVGPAGPASLIPASRAGFSSRVYRPRQTSRGKFACAIARGSLSVGAQQPNQYRGFKSTRESCRVQCCARSARHPVFPAPGPPPDFLSARKWLSAAAEVHSDRPWLRSEPGPACANASRRTAAHCAGSLKA